MLQVAVWRSADTQRLETATPLKVTTLFSGSALKVRPLIVTVCPTLAPVAAGGVSWRVEAPLLERTKPSLAPS
ncbi:hypothetical protein D3C87_1900290 [compost metagenome]